VFIKLPNPSMDTMEEWRGLSPIKVLTRTINRMRSEEDVTVAQLQNGGVEGIVYNKALGLADGVVGAQKDNFGRFIRNKDNKGAPYFAAYEMGYIQLGTPLTDMEVNALAEADQSMVCNVFGVSKVLFNDTSASTESNVQEMVKEMYLNTIIPNVHRVESRLNKEIVPEIRTKGIVKADVSDIDALKIDRVKLLTALSTAYHLTPNEKRTEDGYDQSSDELMNKLLVPSNLVPLEDLVMPPPVDNTANDYVAPAAGRANVVPLKTGTNG
jgi:phage portal protein BeeE